MQRVNNITKFTWLEFGLAAGRAASMPLTNGGARSAISAAKRRKIRAHGVSRGCKWETIEPRRGERRVLTHTSEGWLLFPQEQLMKPRSCSGFCPRNSTRRKPITAATRAISKLETVKM